MTLIARKGLVVCSSGFGHVCLMVVEEYTPVGLPLGFSGTGLESRKQVRLQLYSVP